LIWKKGTTPKRSS